MKMKIILGAIFIQFFIFSFESASYSQSFPEEIIRTAVLIETTNEYASGFYYEDSLYIYFVTARHAIVEKIYTYSTTKQDSLILKQNNIVCKSYPRDPIKGEQNILNVDLKTANSLGKIKAHHSHDIVIIKLGSIEKTANNTLINYYPFVVKTKSSRIDPFGGIHIQKYDSVHVGDKIYIFGYPTSLGIKKSPQYDFQRPLLRSGIIAGKSFKEKTFIIDCPSFPGNSGGPVVVEVPSETGSVFKLIGLIVEFIPYEEQWKNTRNNLINTQLYNSGYSVVEPIDYMFDLIIE